MTKSKKEKTRRKKEEEKKDVKKESEKTKNLEEILKLKVSEIKKISDNLSTEELSKLLELEKSGKKRKSLITFLEKKLASEKSEEKEKEEEKPRVEEKKEKAKEEEKPKKVKPKEKPRKEEKPIEKIKFFGKKKLTPEEKTLMKLRYREKKAIPNFVRQEFYKLNRLKDVWRKPRGTDSKQRVREKAKPKVPKIGYKKCKKIRFLHPSGYFPVLVHNVQELRQINPEKEAAIIAACVGRKKRNEIIKEANELGITILNPRKGEI